MVQCHYGPMSYVIMHIIMVLCPMSLCTLLWSYGPDSHSILKTSRPNPGRSEKIKLNLYFRTSLWCLKKFYEGL